MDNISINKHDQSRLLLKGWLGTTDLEQVEEVTDPNLERPRKSQFY